MALTLVDQGKPATSAGDSSIPATQPEPSASATEQRAPESQATDQSSTETPAEDWKAKLTSDQRKELLRDADPDEVLAANDRLQGHVGKLAQRQAGEATRAYERQQALVADLSRRQQALNSRDPDALQEIVSNDLQGISRTLTEQQRQQTAPWDGAVALFTSGLLPDEIVKPLRGKDYGQDADSAAKGFYKDLESGFEKHFRSKLESQIRKELEPVIEKEVRARLAGDEPTPDTGSGGSPGTAKRWTRDQIARMSSAEFARNEDSIMAALAKRGAA